jgi:hypothetical protein
MLSILEGKKQVRDVEIKDRKILHASEQNQQFKKDRIYVPEVMVQNRTF